VLQGAAAGGGGYDDDDDEDVDDDDDEYLLIPNMTARDSEKGNEPIPTELHRQFQKSSLKNTGRVRQHAPRSGVMMNNE
jgi:hypothetical protein